MSKIEVNTVDAQCGSTITVGSSGKNVKIEGNDIRSNDYKASDGGNIINQSGTTITLGASGDTINLASGASQSGFGRTGTVDWQTTKKTASFTAVSGEGYFVDTSSAAITVTLPASPSAGDIVSVKDYAGDFDTNSCTIARNGSNIRGATNNFILDKENSGAAFIYVDATEGWQIFIDGSDADAQRAFITATGGTVTTSGDYKIHTFTGPGTFCVSCSGDESNSVDYLVIAGGGGGGSDQGGGGGAGGYRESSGASSGCYTRSPLGACVAAISVTAQPYPITVGSGGTGAELGNRDSAKGSNSVFSVVTSEGGGRGGTLGHPVPQQSGGPGGSGGGGGGTVGNVPSTTGGSGNTPPVSPPQGTNGAGQPGSLYGGGGGGATVAGAESGCAGGTGATSCITASPVKRAGGGGGRSSTTPAGVPYGAGAYGPGGSGNHGTANTGSGGGGGGAGGPAPNNTAGNGGSGVVILRYKYQ